MLVQQIVLFVAVAVQVALGGLYVYGLYDLQRRRTRWLKYCDGRQQEIEALYDDLRRKLHELPDRYRDYCANPTDPKWARGLFHDDHDPQIH